MVLGRERKKTMIFTTQEHTAIPIEERIKTLKPVCSGLYPHEVLALFYAHKYSTGTNLYEGFWEYRYGISDMDALLNSLYLKGFLQTGSLEDTMSKATTATLKDIAFQYGLPKSGSKADLIQRLLNNVNRNDLEVLFPNRFYSLTPQGQSIVEKENYVKYIHNQKDSDLTIWNFSEMMHNEPSATFEEVFVQYYIDQSTKFLYQQSYGLYRNSLFSIFDFLFSQKQYDDALCILSKVIYCDLSGLSNSFDGHSLFHAPRFFPYEESFITIPPALSNRIHVCQEKLSLSDEELSSKIADSISNFKLPFHIFTLDECVDIILLEIHGQKEELRILYQRAEERFLSSEQYAIMHKTDKECNTAHFGITAKKLAEIAQKAREELKISAENDEKIYDTEFEREIEERLSKLDKQSKDEFYRLRAHRKNDGILSAKELDRLTLEAMERSYKYRDVKQLPSP